MDQRKITAILLEQREEIAELVKLPLVEREVMGYASEFLSSSLIKVIKGVRRCGKSVLGHQLLRGHAYGYINFDDERLLDVKADELGNFLEALYGIAPKMEYLFLDEIQNVRGWELFVNRLRRKGINILLSGSNANLLSQELATHLTGRYIEIEIMPFSFREFIKLNGFEFARLRDFSLPERRAQIKQHLEHYIHMGGFPERMPERIKPNYLRELFDKIITRDIIIRHKVRYGQDLKEIALYCLTQSGSKISYNQLSKIFHIKSVPTIQNYLAYLQESYLQFQVDAFSFRLKQKIKTAKKLYSIDTGMLNALTRKVTPDFGLILELLVFLELRRRQKEIYYFNSPSCEVDFLIKEGRKVSQLIQVCYSCESLDTRKREIRGLLKASSDTRCQNLLIITWDEEGEEQIDSKTIRLIPIWKWLLMQ